MAKYCHDCLHYEVCRLLIGEREVYINDIACHFAEQCGGYKNKADYVNVVRCKDCKYCRTFYPIKEIGKEAIQVWYCDLYRCNRKPDEFCSDGERREGE